MRHIIAVGSGKGGVGKSTVAVNLALGLRNAGLRAGVLDADIYGPSLPTLLNLSGKPEVDSQNLLVPLENYGLKAMSLGFLMPPDAAAIWRGPMLSSALKSIVQQVQWGTLDVLVVDLPPGTGDVQITVSQVMSLTGAVVVTTPQQLALADVKRAISMFSKVHVDVLGVVENMSWLECSSCGEQQRIFGEGGGAEALAFAKKDGTNGSAQLWQLPMQPSLQQASDKGVPLLLPGMEKDSAVERVFRTMAEYLLPTIQAQPASGGPEISFS